MSSLGLYAVCPGCGGYNEFVFGVPLFDAITLSVKDNKKLLITVLRRLNREKDIYIQSLYINGQHYDCGFIALDKVLEGGDWRYVVGSRPNKTRARQGRSCLDFYRWSS